MASAMPAFHEAMRALDAVHARDPRFVGCDGEQVPEELDYARRMSAALAQVDPDASLALRLAVRAQHLERWSLPRVDYPAGPAGYHRWRNEQKSRHAALASDVLAGAGVDAPTIARVAELVQKKNLRRDPETQALEDAACLVFIEAQLANFAEGRDESSLISIVQKTWAKMSPKAQALALALPLAEDVRALLERALAG